MIVCLCKAVSDRHIRAAVHGGASCLRDLSRELRLGTGCGKCIPEAKAALDACLGQRDDRGPETIALALAEFAA